jgi:putative membrane protein
MIPALLLAIYLAEFVGRSVHPCDRGVWIAENIPVVLVVAFFGFTYRWFRFLNVALC